MQYKPAIAVRWNAISEAAYQKYFDDDRNTVLEPVYELMARISLPITCSGLEVYLEKVLTWLRVNKYPFEGNDVWVEELYIVIHGDDELIAEMVVNEREWQITQCTV